MKKLIIAIVLLAVLAPMTQAVARDANRDALREAWKVQQAQQKKERENLVNVGGGTIQIPKHNPSQDRPDYDAPGLWEPAP